MVVHGSTSRERPSSPPPVEGSRRVQLSCGTQKAPPQNPSARLATRSTRMSQPRAPLLQPPPLQQTRCAMTSPSTRLARRRRSGKPRSQMRPLSCSNSHRHRGGREREQRGRPMHRLRKGPLAAPLRVPPVVSRPFPRRHLLTLRRLLTSRQPSREQTPQKPVSQSSKSGALHRAHARTLRWPRSSQRGLPQLRLLLALLKTLRLETRHSPRRGQTRKLLGLTHHGARRLRRMLRGMRRRLLSLTHGRMSTVHFCVRRQPRQTRLTHVLRSLF